ncbi:SDR family oxidoreductase [Photobacterium damselae]|uniref:SDR family oxidoreductase n=1 Tax=Photobacterium damselae TaxID=38293 RepID=UPI00159F9D93|nr:SDR family oxidoreductase [Photobacterium damselae]NVO62322.1 SDR family oxidoreductase [Photobacterium damselae subsp. damselae]
MKVSICGCGWLGEPLALHLLDLGYEVFGSKTSQDGVNKIRQRGINCCEISVPLDNNSDYPYFCEDKDKRAFFATDVLVINVPPKLRSSDKQSHIHNIKTLMTAAEYHGCKRIIFISTTAVYGDTKGRVTESTKPRPQTESGKAHLEIERQLLDTWPDRSTILRLSGLIGPNRHPVKFLSGRKDIEKGADPVNLIHLTDCIAAISRIIAKQPPSPILHLAANSHPSRASYYTQMAELAKLPLPNFSLSPDSHENGKWIDASMTLKALDLTLVHSDLISLAPEL